MSDDGSFRLKGILESERQHINAYANDRMRAVNGLVQAIRSAVSIDRYQIGGSIGKGTSLGPRFNPDIDVNLLINGPSAHYSIHQDLEAILQNQVNVIATHLRARCRRFCKVLYPAQAPTAVSKSVGVYLFREQCNVDLIPGINLSHQQDQQYHVVLSRIMILRTDLPWANLCYSEESVRFIKSKDEFSLNVVRAAKYWNKLCVSMAPLSGRSTIVEIVALKAAQDELDNCVQNPSLREALVRFFNYMVQPWYGIRIVVRYDRTQHWHDIAQFKVQEWDLQPSSFLVDPVNPFRNFMDDQKVQDKWQHFQDGARKSLQKIGAGLIEEAIGFKIH